MEVEMTGLAGLVHRTELVARFKRATLIFWVPLVVAAVVPVILTIVALVLEKPESIRLLPEELRVPAVKSPPPGTSDPNIPPIALPAVETPSIAELGQGRRQRLASIDRTTLEACLKRAASGPALLDRLKSISSPALRDSLSKRLEDPAPPSDCAPVPAALSSMYSCVETEASFIQQGYSSLGDELGTSRNQNQCDRPVSEFDQAYQVLDQLKKRADIISAYSENQLSKCNSRWSVWLDATSKPKENQSDSAIVQNTAVVARTMNELINGLQDELGKVVETQTRAQSTIKNIYDSLGVVEANVLSRLLKCN